MVVARKAATMDATSKLAQFDPLAKDLAATLHVALVLDLAVRGIALVVDEQATGGNLQEWQLLSTSRAGASPSGGCGSEVEEASAANTATERLSALHMLARECEDVDVVKFAIAKACSISALLEA